MKKIMKKSMAMILAAVALLTQAGNAVIAEGNTVPEFGYLLYDRDFEDLTEDTAFTSSTGGSTYVGTQTMTTAKVVTPTGTDRGKAAYIEDSTSGHAFKMNSSIRRFKEYDVTADNHAQKIIVKFDVQRVAGKRTPNFALLAGTGAATINQGMAFIDKNGKFAVVTATSGKSAPDETAVVGKYYIYENELDAGRWYTITAEYDKDGGAVNWYVDNNFVYSALLPTEASVYAQRNIYEFAGFNLENPGHGVACYIDNVKIGAGAAAPEILSPISSVASKTLTAGSSTKIESIDLGLTGKEISKNYMVSFDVTSSAPAMRGGLIYLRNDEAAPTGTSTNILGGVLLAGNDLVCKKTMAYTTATSLSTWVDAAARTEDNAKEYLPARSVVNAGESFNVKIYVNQVNHTSTYYINDAYVTTTTANSNTGTLAKNIYVLLPNTMTAGGTLTFSNINVGYTEELKMNVTDLRLVNDSGADITSGSVEAGSYIYAEAELVNDKDVDKTVQIIIAQYNENLLIDSSCKEITVPAGQSYTLTWEDVEYSPEAVVKAEATEIKAFAWDKTTIEAYCDNVEKVLVDGE